MKGMCNKEKLNLKERNKNKIVIDNYKFRKILKNKKCNKEEE